MVLLFDLDGTLLDSNGVWKQVDIDFLAKRGLPWSQEYHEGVVHVGLQAGAVFTKAFCHLTESEEEIIAEWLEMVHHHYAHTIPLKAGVAEFLKNCREQGLRMAIYTSCDRVLCEAALEHHGIRSYFEQVFYASELGVEKRSPEGFLIAAKCLGELPENIRFYDDSPLSCAAAKEAGMVTVGVLDGMFASYEAEMQAKCDNYIRSFAEESLDP